jgi:hydroxyacylglutathione hydrolase
MDRMLVKRFFEPALAQASYLIGCAAARDAVVVDANRDVEAYLRAADAENVRITHVTETHIHADYVSGSRELAARTGAALLLSDEGDADWKYQFAGEGRLIRHGDRIQIGNVRLEVVHTPGHTPEHVSFLVTDGAVADQPIAALTGDFIFVGDVGRPDLLERAANYKGTMEIGARTLWASLQRFNAAHEDYLQIWPGHGAGSACGKGISAIPHSTLGYERRFNWAFKAAGEAAFVAEVLAGQPDPPKYFATMKRINKEGPRLLGGFPEPRRRSDEELADPIRDDQLVIDTRPAEEYARGHVPGTINIPFNSSFVTWAGWLVPYGEPLHLIVDAAAGDRVREAVRALALIGLDEVTSVFTSRAVDRWPDEFGPLATVPQLAGPDLARQMSAGGLSVVDVRSPAEWHEGHLPGAQHIPLGYLTDRLAEIPRDRRVVLQCRTGARSSIAASLLRRHGIPSVANLAGGIVAWQEAGLPVERDQVSAAAV